MKHRVLLLGISATLAAPTPTAAGTDRTAREVFESYTQCVVKKHPKDAAAVVLSTISEKEIFKSYSNLVTPDCLDTGDLTMPGADFLRYGLAEALVRREYATGLPVDFARAGSISHFQLDESDYEPKPGKPASTREVQRLDEQKKKDIAIRILSIYGECVVRASPPAALRLVLSTPSTSNEAEAFGLLGPALSACLTQGQTIALDKTAIRGSIALNLYRLAHAPRVPAASATK